MNNAVNDFIDALGQDYALASVVAVVKQNRKSVVIESADAHALRALEMRATRRGAIAKMSAVNRIEIRFR